MGENESPGLEEYLKKINPESEEYRVDREMTKAAIEDSSTKGESVSGRYELDMIESMQTILPQEKSRKQPTEEEINARSHTLLSNCQESLRSKNLAVDKGFIPHIVAQNFFLETIKDKHLKKKLAAELKKNRKTNQLVDENLFEYSYNLTQAFLKNKITFSDDVFESMLRVHADNVRKANERFQEIVPPIVAEFKQQFEKEIREGTFSFKQELLDQRLDEITFSVTDSMSAILENMGGNFDAEFSKVLISHEFVETTRMKHIAFHELLHAMSGRIATEKRIGENDENSYEEMSHQRIGTHFFRPEKSKNGAQRFRWLNEAITEKLAWRLLGHKTIREAPTNLSELLTAIGSSINDEDAGVPTAAYPQERKIFDLLLQKGGKPLDEKLFIAAYFENFNPDAADPIPAWKAMTRAVRDAYGGNILLELDKLIKKDGLKKAIEFLESRNQQNSHPLPERNW